LIVEVQAVEEALSVDLSFSKAVVDVPSSVVGPARTWSEGRIGTHFGSGDFVLNIITRLTDTFIDDSLRVNAEAC